MYDYRIEQYVTFNFAGQIQEFMLHDKLLLVDNHFTAHCEMIFAVINLQFAVIDLQNFGSL